MKTDKNIEKFTKYIIKEGQVESPSPDFLDKVMTSVKLEHKLSLAKVYKPLISKKVWVLIAIVFIVVSGSILKGKPLDNSILSNLDFSFFDKLSSFNIFENIPSINIFDSIHFSNTFTFSTMFFSVLVIFQIIVIKNYINRANATL